MRLFAALLIADVEATLPQSRVLAYRGNTHAIRAFSCSLIQPFGGFAFPAATDKLFESGSRRNLLFEPPRDLPTDPGCRSLVAVVEKRELQVSEQSPSFDRAHPQRYWRAIGQLLKLDRRRSQQFFHTRIVVNRHIPGASEHPLFAYARSGMIPLRTYCALIVGIR